MSCHLRYPSSILRQVDGHEFECAGAIGNDYQVVDDGFDGDAIIYRTSVLTLQNYGKEGIDEMDQWGKVHTLLIYLDPNFPCRDGLAMPTLSIIRESVLTSSTLTSASAALAIFRWVKS